VAIDMSKIAGTWRTIGSRNEEKTSYYTKMTFGKSGMYIRERMEDGISRTRKQGRYSLNQQDSTFVFIADSATYKYKIEKLTDLCFEAMSLNDNHFLKLERLR
jgi:hypothetical protein